MSGSASDGRGTVFLAHAWCPVDYKPLMVGPWHWWNVYQSEESATMQAVRTAKGWKQYGRWEVRRIEGPDYDPA
ncbi:hypothetical protein [Sciscionella marina]|uniref:hypothetical protein n=1 Tax=Sciscionella marina TaxID=508770 RepID=UPI0012F6B898|nr:hypothetical protein [Sciscionella marina]